TTTSGFAAAFPSTDVPRASAPWRQHHWRFGGSPDAEANEVLLNREAPVGRARHEFVIAGRHLDAGARGGTGAAPSRNDAAVGKALDGPARGPFIGRPCDARLDRLLLLWRRPIPGEARPGLRRYDPHGRPPPSLRPFVVPLAGRRAAGYARASKPTETEWI